MRLDLNLPFAQGVNRSVLKGHWMTTNGQKMATDAQKPQLIEIPQVAYTFAVS